MSILEQGIRGLEGLTGGKLHNTDTEVKLCRAVSHTRPKQDFCQTGRIVPAAVKNITLEIPRATAEDPAWGT